MLDSNPDKNVRQIALDTETTGLEVDQGHRIIEIGCVEIKHRRITDQIFHQFLNPERDIEEGAMEVHGIERTALEDRPVFSDIADDLIQFIEGAELIIHNADFDVGFINTELSLAGHNITDIHDCCTITDSLTLARKIHIGQKNNLDALCERYEIDNSEREVHGALLDARLLAKAYLAMTGGQPTLDLTREPEGLAWREQFRHNLREPLKIIHANEEELRAHEAVLKNIQEESDTDCLWLKKQSE